MKTLLLTKKLSLWAIALWSLPSIADIPTFKMEVTAPRVKKEPQFQEELISATSKVSGYPENAVLRLAGVATTKQGGPASTTMIQIRGMSAHRIKIDLEGLNLADPTNGWFDFSGLPYLAISSISAKDGRDSRQVGNNISFTLPKGRQSLSRAQFMIGSFGTGRTEIALAAPLNQSTVFFAGQITTSEGKFPFLAHSTAGNRTFFSDTLTRRNNDQQRAVGIFRATYNPPSWQLSSMLFGSFHEGGIPGFAMAPTKSLRGRNSFLASLISAQHWLTTGKIRLTLSTKFNNRTTWSIGQDNDSKVRSNSTSLLLHLKKPINNIGSTLTTELEATATEIFATTFRRYSVSAATSIRKSFAGPFAPVIQTGASINLVSHIGLLYGGFVNGFINFSKKVVTGLKITRSARAPTISELFAPSGVVLGNNELASESSWDAESYAVFKPSDSLSGRVSAYIGWLFDAIFFVHRNAFELVPINLERAFRLGTEGTITYSPLPYFESRLVLSLLQSSLSETKAPLPNTPNFNMLVSTRFGRSGSAVVVVNVNSRGTSSSNIFGTLLSPGYTLTDITLTLPIEKSIQLSASIHNLFNIKDARDMHQFPLPSRELFFTISLGS